MYEGQDHQFTVTGGKMLLVVGATSIEGLQTSVVCLA